MPVFPAPDCCRSSSAGDDCLLLRLEGLVELSGDVPNLMECSELGSKPVGIGLWVVDSVLEVRLGDVEMDGSSGMRWELRGDCWPASS